MELSNLKKDIHIEVVLTNLQQRLRLLEDRVKTHAKFIHEVRDSLYRGTCYTRLHEFVTEKEKQEEEDGIIDLTEDTHVFTQDNTSRAQLVRITAQCFATYNTFLRVESRD